MNPIYRSEDAVEVWVSFRVEANYSSDLTQTTGDTFGYGSLHHLTPEPYRPRLAGGGR